MKPIKLKTSKEMNLNSIFVDYVTKNYGQQSITDKLQYYFSDFNQNRNVISHNKDNLYKIKDLILTLEITTKYFNQLIAIKSKMVFGSQPQCCNINFSWTDTITDNLWASNNINFEYYNVLFNIASLYFHLGYQKSLSPKVDKELRKEAIKDYKYSLYLFNIIKDEAKKKIEHRELPYDLYPAHCEYCATLCIIYGQIEIVKIAEETSPNEYILRGKLLMGIAENYNKAYLLSNGEPTKNGGKVSFRNYLLNRYFYYKSLVYKKLAEILTKKFDDTGLGYGEALVYQRLNMQELTECQKTVNYCEGLVEVEKFNNVFNNEKKILEKMEDLNHRIYHQFTPDPKTIKLESKILMVPLIIENLYIGENKLKFKDDPIINCEDLNLLTPNEIKPMLDRYKSQMTNFIQQYLSNYENENTIKSFIEKLNLPQKLIIKPIDTKNPKSVEIPSRILDKISQIKQLGGSFYLNDSMKKILSKSNELLENLNLILKDIKNEENEDNYYRQKLGDQWVINPSNSLNMNYIQNVNNYIAKINQSREYDIQENNQLNENIKRYDELNLTKNQIEQKIILLGQVNVQMTSEEKKIRDEIVKLYSLGDKSYNIINPILNEIKTGSAVIPFFAEVLINRMTEKSVFEVSKEKYLKRLEPMKDLNNEIKNQMKTINDLIPSISENIIFPKGNDNPVSKYFDSLEQNANDFLDTIQKLKKAENYYMDLENNINKLIKAIKDWLEKRKEEKKMLLGTMRGNIAKYDPNKVVNPFDNGNGNNNVDYYNANNMNNNYNPNFNQQNFPVNQNNANGYGYNNQNNNYYHQNNNYYNQNQNQIPPNNEYYYGYSNMGANNNNRFQPNNNFGDHFNPNQPNNINNNNPNIGKTFGPNNYNGPYNNNRGY